MSKMGMPTKASEKPRVERTKPAMVTVDKMISKLWMLILLLSH